MTLIACYGNASSSTQPVRRRLNLRSSVGNPGLFIAPPWANPQTQSLRTWLRLALRSVVFALGCASLPALAQTPAITFPVAPPSDQVIRSSLESGYQAQRASCKEERERCTTACREQSDAAFQKRWLELQAGGARTQLLQQAKLCEARCRATATRCEDGVESELGAQVQSERVRLSAAPGTQPAVERCSINDHSMRGYTDPKLAELREQLLAPAQTMVTGEHTEAWRVAARRHGALARQLKDVAGIGTGGSPLNPNQFGDGREIPLSYAFDATPQSRALRSYIANAWQSEHYRRLLGDCSAP